MPFTVSHAAAVIPLFRPHGRLFGRFSALSALVIGSLTPDLPYFIPVPIHRGATHSLSGLLTFCVPAGLVLYVVYHLFLKHPLVALLPDEVGLRLSRITGPIGCLPRHSLGKVVGAILLGALTHIFWDAFTHRGGFGVALMPWLKVRLFAIGPLDMHGYALLQHLSTIVGLALLARWSRRWLQQRGPIRSTLRAASRRASAALPQARSSR
jgi:membrane-bound metal-dependent hydrolase YbcI (DUF457 family)